MSTEPETREEAGFAAWQARNVREVGGRVVVSTFAPRTTAAVLACMTLPPLTGFIVGDYCLGIGGTMLVLLIGASLLRHQVWTLDGQLGQLTIEHRFAWWRTRTQAFARSATPVVRVLRFERGTSGYDRAGVLVVDAAAHARTGSMHNVMCAQWLAQRVAHLMGTEVEDDITLKQWFAICRQRR